MVSCSFIARHVSLGAVTGLSSLQSSVAWCWRDNEFLARIYNAAWRTQTKATSVLLTASLDSRDEVDTTYARMLSVGYKGSQPPYDAFWGARYAIVVDPEGNDVGLMSPVDPALRSWPPADSPSP